ncbi:MAG TPA: hypothetical protein VNG33_16405, partial [Polyangiaceae bacterium]|nr:hypothetical protein [Polyangiaceae bacterium]
MNFANCTTQAIDWTNEHGTFMRSGVERYLPVASTSRELIDQWRRVGSVLQDIVGYAFANRLPLRPDGSRWSLSNIAQPERLAVSLAAHDVAEEIPLGWRSPAYAASLAASGLTPMLVSGSMKIQRLNRTLALRNLALQTSGASDGQTLAGACATGTHGAALRLGAFHDTFRALHFMVGPQAAVLVQPTSGPLTAQAAADLTNWLGFPTTLRSDDTLFAAAQVHLGSLGILLNAVVETRPLYFWTEVTSAHSDDAWRRVLAEQSPASVAGHSPTPNYLQVVLNPYQTYPAGSKNAWVISMTDAPFTNQTDVDTRVEAAFTPNPDLLSLLSTLEDTDDLDLTDLPIRMKLTSELIDRYGDGIRTRRALPGVIFGPSGLPRGRGASVEFVVDGGQAEPAASLLLEALAAEYADGRQFMGAIGIRFVKGSSALLAPNARPMSCFLELPGIRTDEVPRIYDTCGNALARHGVAFGCHWGQYLVEMPERLTT